MVHDDNKVKRMSKYEGVNYINNGAGTGIEPVRPLFTKAADFKYAAPTADAHKQCAVAWQDLLCNILCNELGAVVC